MASETPGPSNAAEIVWRIRSNSLRKSREPAATPKMQMKQGTRSGYKRKALCGRRLQSRSETGFAVKEKLNNIPEFIY